MDKLKKDGRFKKRELLHFGVDYFKAYIEYNYKPKILKLGLSANSNIFYIDDDTYIELGSPDVFKGFDKYFMLKDKKTGISLGFLIIPKVGKVGAIHYNNIFEVSGQGLILRNLKFYFNFIKWAGFTIEKFKRVDICFDLKAELKYIYERILNKYIEGKTIEPIVKRGVLETLYIGERNTKKNTYQLIRIYDKVRDTIGKNKNHLYGFDKNENITRFEVELRRDKAQFMTEKKLLDDDYIFSVIRATFYKMNYQYFKFLHLEDYKNVRLQEESLYLKRKFDIEKRNEQYILYGNDFKNDTEEQRTLKLFINAGKRLYKSGYSRKKILNLLKKHGIN